MTYIGRPSFVVRNCKLHTVQTSPSRGGCGPDDRGPIRAHSIPVQTEILLWSPVRNPTCNTVVRYYSTFGPLEGFFGPRAGPSPKKRGGGRDVLSPRRLWWVLASSSRVLSPHRNTKSVELLRSIFLPQRNKKNKKLRNYLFFMCRTKTNQE